MNPTLPARLSLGHYVITDLSAFAPGKVSILDTRTGEGGSFDLDAVMDTLEAALDTFFTATY